MHVALLSAVVAVGRRLLTGGAVLYVLGWLVRQAWRAGHPAFDTRGYREVVVHAPMWLGALVLSLAAAWALIARGRGPAAIALVGGLANLAAEAWHAWAHYSHREYSAAH